MSERLLDDHPREWAAALRIGDHLFCAEELGDGREKLRRHGQVVDPPPARAARPIAFLQFLIEPGVTLRLGEVALDVEETFGEILPDGVIDRARSRVLVAC